jgi:hypothetical protein
MDFIANLAKKHHFHKKINKINRVGSIYVGFFQNNLTNEMFKSHFKTILHISLV